MDNKKISVMPTSSYNMRTPIQNLQLDNYKVDIPQKNTYKRVVLVAAIALIALLMYSSMAYSVTDHIASNLNMDLFGHDGEPSILAMAIHTVVYAIIIFLIFTVTKIC